jgi:hypothetical protein
MIPGRYQDKPATNCLSHDTPWKWFILTHGVTLLLAVCSVTASITSVKLWIRKHVSTVVCFLLGGIYLPMKMEQTECSETLAFKLQTPGNHPEESIQHSEHGESLKSRMWVLLEGWRMIHKLTAVFCHLQALNININVLLLTDCRIKCSSCAVFTVHIIISVENNYTTQHQVAHICASWPYATVELFIQFLEF